MEYTLERGALYVVGTPIGNLGDFSPRARETLEQADFVAAEDTRVTLKLLNTASGWSPNGCGCASNGRGRPLSCFCWSAGWGASRG